MISRPHWSYSAINQFLRCPLQFYFERVLGLPQKTVSSNLVLGSAVHKTLEAYHRGLQNGTPAKEDELKTAFLSSWESREKNSEISYRNGDSRDGVLDQGIGLIELYLKEPPPSDILAVEKDMIVPLHNSQGAYLETPLVVVIDLVTRTEEGLKIVEFKTSGRAYGGFEADTSLQPTCYVNAIREVYGEPATVEFTVLVKTKTPKIQRLSAFRDGGDLCRLGDLVQTVERAIEVGAFFPVENPMNCSGCAHRQSCLDWGKPRESESKQTIMDDALEVASC